MDGIVIALVGAAVILVLNSIASILREIRDKMK